MTDPNRRPILVLTEDLPTVSVSELHRRVGETINRVHFGEQPILITNRGKPYAIIVPVHVGEEGVQLVEATAPEETSP